MNAIETSATASAQAKVPVAVIGFGAAGVNAVIGMRTAGYRGPVRVFSDTETLPYSPILTSYYAGGKKTYEECFPWSGDDIADLGVEMALGERVVDLDPAAHRIRIADGTEYTYGKCVIATGARPSTAGFPSVEGYEPLVLRTLDDAERLKAALESESCMRLLVSGASMIALKCVEAALNRDVTVSMVGMNAHVLDFTALPIAAERFERGLASQGVEMRFGQTIRSVRAISCDERGRASMDASGDGANAQGAAKPARKLEVTFSGGDTELFDEIVVAHGVRSNLDFVRPETLAVDRALVVDDFMRTSDPDVYAAGDVAQATELVSGEKRVLGIWKTAAMQGQVAGRAIAAEIAGGEPALADAYPGAFMMNAIAVNDTLFLSAGAFRVEEGMRVEVSESDEMTVACIFASDSGGGERLVGFNVASDRDEPGGVAYDTAAMLCLRIEEGCRA